MAALIILGQAMPKFSPRASKCLGYNAELFSSESLMSLLF